MWMTVVSLSAHGVNIRAMILVQGSTGFHNGKAGRGRAADIAQEDLVVEAMSMVTEK